MPILNGPRFSQSSGAEVHFLKEARYVADQTPEREVVVDLSSLNMITSENLNQLIRFQSELRQQGRTLVLEDPQDEVFEVFELTRLDRLFVIRRAGLSVTAD